MRICPISEIREKQYVHYTFDEAAPVFVVAVLDGSAGGPSAGHLDFGILRRVVHPETPSEETRVESEETVRVSPWPSSQCFGESCSISVEFSIAMHISPSCSGNFAALRGSFLSVSTGVNESRPRGSRGGRRADRPSRALSHSQTTSSSSAERGLGRGWRRRRRLV